MPAPPAIGPGASYRDTAGQAVPGLADTTEEAIARRQKAEEEFRQMGKEHDRALQAFERQQAQAAHDAEAAGPENERIRARCGPGTPPATARKAAPGDRALICTGPTKT